MIYFDIREVIKQVPHASAFYICGQGGAGKSYSVKKYLIENLIENNKGFIYIKRYATEFSAGELNTVFSDVIKDKELYPKLVKKYDPRGEFDRLHIFQTGSWFSVKGETEDGKLQEIKKVGRIASISQAHRFKGGTYNDYNALFFDEFISTQGYIRGEKEPELLDLIIGTVARKDNPIRLFMCANPDAPIELCPYLYKLKLDYAHMQENTIYKYDTITPNGKTIADNVVFMKLSNFSGATFINEKAGYLFGTSAERVRMDGEVITYEYIHMDYKKRFTPEYELIVETPKISNNEYHVRLYVYYGIVDGGEPAAVICRHKEFDDLPALYCRYDRTDYKKRDIPQTYRLNIPPHANYKRLASLMTYVDATQILITDDDNAGTLYEHIRLNKK